MDKTAKRKKSAANAREEEGEQEMSEKVSFLATLPLIQSAIKISGDGDLVRITLEAPRSEVPQAMRIVLFTGQVFRVTIEAETRTELNDETEKGAKAGADRVGRRRSLKR